MIRLFIYLYVFYLLMKKVYDVIINYKEYYSEKNQLKQVNKKIKLNLVKVTTPKKMAKGLMNRKKKLKSNEGMLFVYKKPQISSMWMKNTHIPLCLIMLDKNFFVIEIIEYMEPHNENSYKSKKKCKYAIEMNSNAIQKNKIYVGSIIEPNFVTNFKP